MPGRASEPGLKLVQCPKCRRSFRSTHLSDHRCFYHGDSREQLQRQVEELVQELCYSLPIEVIDRLSPMALEKMSETQLVRWWRYLEERRQPVGSSSYNPELGLGS